jgi:hypothetical protein
MQSPLGNMITKHWNPSSSLTTPSSIIIWSKYISKDSILLYLNIGKHWISTLLYPNVIKQRIMLFVSSICKDNILIHGFTYLTIFLLQTRSMQGTKCRFCNSTKMESWCGSTFHRLHHDFDQSQQTLECGHHPTSRKSRVGWQDVDIIHSTPRFLEGWSQISRTPYSNMFTEGLDSERF